MCEIVAWLQSNLLRRVQMILFVFFNIVKGLCLLNYLHPLGLSKYYSNDTNETHVVHR